MKDKTALNAAFAELDYEDSAEDLLTVFALLRATEKSWQNMTDAQYERLVQQEEKLAIKPIKYELNGIDE
jgi:hypothetical protein